MTKVTQSMEGDVKKSCDYKVFTYKVTFIQIILHGL